MNENILFILRFKVLFPSFYKKTVSYFDTTTPSIELRLNCMNTEHYFYLDDEASAELSALY